MPRITPRERGDAPELEDVFSRAERAALRMARSAGSVPNAVTDEDMEALKAHFDEDRIVELVGGNCLPVGAGWLNRWNDTMAAPLEERPIVPGVGAGARAARSGGHSVSGNWRGRTRPKHARKSYAGRIAASRSEPASWKSRFKPDGAGSSRPSRRPAADKGRFLAGRRAWRRSCDMPALGRTRAHAEALRIERGFARPSVA